MQPVNAESLPLALPAFRTAGYVWKAVAAAERVLAGALLVVVSPLLLPAALILAISSRRSPLIAHRRVGQGGRPIWVLKLRTMRGGPGKKGPLFLERLSIVDNDVQGHKAVGDPRVTGWFARFCRRYSIDEFPQLWQVVLGDMALVAPRPLTRYELETYYGADAGKLVARKPGLTGLWQISGRSRLTYSQRRRLDLFMIRNWSLPLYFRILIRTLPRVLTGKDAW